MLNRKPETYNEIVHLRKMIDLCQYYDISSKLLDDISDFILKSTLNHIKIIEDKCYFYEEDNIVRKIKLIKKRSEIGGIILNDKTLTLLAPTVLNHRAGEQVKKIIQERGLINPAEFYQTGSYGSSGSSFGGGSSNNNNNNNNNN